VAIVLAWPDENSRAPMRLGGTFIGTLFLDGSIMARYFLHLVWPLNLAAYYSVNEDVSAFWPAFSGWVVVGLVAGALLLSARDRREQALLGIAALAMVGPTLNLMNQVMAMADHYIQPAIPFCVLMAIRVIEPWRQTSERLGIRNPIAVLGGSCVLLFASISFPRTLQFSSSKAFILQSLKASPRSGFMLGHAVTYFGSMPSMQDRQVSGLAATAAVQAPDFFRAPLSAREQALYLECDRLTASGQTASGQAPEAHQLLNRHMALISGVSLIYIRAMILAGSGDQSAALGMLERIAPVDREFVEQVWITWKRGDLMPAIQTATVGQRPQGIIAVTNALDGSQNAQFQLQRTIHTIAQLHLEAGRYEEAAKYAMTMVAINPRMIHTWPVLAAALDHLGKPKRAAAARARHAILQADLVTVSAIDD